MKGESLLVRVGLSERQRERERIRGRRRRRRSLIGVYFFSH